MEEFKFKCPQCGQEVLADESLRGQVLECPYCSNSIVVPGRGLRRVEKQSSCSTDPEKTILVTQPALVGFRLWFVIFGFYFFPSSILVFCGGLFSCVGVLGVLFWGGIAAVLYAWCRTTKYIITNKRVLAERGILVKTSTSVRFDDIRAVATRRGPVQRKYNLASIAIATAATAGTEIVLVGVQDWEKVMSVINEHRNGGCKDDVVR
jgi:membrane protein YdbS with pleckstrin-like domain/DNA-directed RNA polymerase subunit RPC12/RpoP